MEEECLGSVRFRTLIIGMMIVRIGREGFVDWVVIMLIVKGGRVEEVEDFFFVGECVGGVALRVRARTQACLTSLFE
jgi:hypothetical protein